MFKKIQKKMLDELLKGRASKAGWRLGIDAGDDSKAYIFDGHWILWLPKDRVLLNADLHGDQTERRFDASRFMQGAADANLKYKHNGIIKKVDKAQAVVLESEDGEDILIDKKIYELFDGEGAITTHYKSKGSRRDIVYVYDGGTLVGAMCPIYYK